MHTEEKKIHKRIYLTLKKNPQCASVITGKHSFEILKAFEKGKNLINVMKVMIHLITSW